MRRARSSSEKVEENAKTAELVCTAIQATTANGERAHYSDESEGDNSELDEDACDIGKVCERCRWDESQ